jgi:hypothetical protein
MSRAADLKTCAACGELFACGRNRGAKAWSLAKYCSRKCFGATKTTHGHTRGGITATYRAWVNMRNRCENPQSTQFAHYGERGIKVCERWHTYENFLADVGERPSPKHSLDRYPDVNGNYEPGNVRWATQTEQCRNRRNTRAVVRDDGARFSSIPEAADAVGGDYKAVWAVCNGEQKTHRGRSWRYA